MSSLKKFQHFRRESREGGEAAAESCDEQQLYCVVWVFTQISDNQSDTEAAEEVGGYCVDGKTAEAVFAFRQEHGDQVTCRAAEAAAEEDEKDVFEHIFIKLIIN